MTAELHRQMADGLRKDIDEAEARLRKFIHETGDSGYCWDCLHPWPDCLCPDPRD